MRIAISNIAWDVPEDAAVAEVLRRHGVDAVDVAPSKYFASVPDATEADIKKVRGWWADQGIALTGMQSLLFGTTGLNVFGPPEGQAALLERMRHVCRIGAGLGATRLVFGSPKNRDRTGLSDEQTLEVATDFFRRLGEVAQAAGVRVCLEPNPPRYGANFMMRSDETAAVVRRVDHPAIRMQLDTGAVTINEERPEEVVKQYAPLIGHIHASEPDLVPVGDGATDHASFATALAASLPDHVVSIEMLTTKEEPHVQAIERAVMHAVRHYRNPGAAS